MRKIIQDIASEYNLEKDWLNDGVKGFISPKMKFEKFRDYSNLTISNIDAEGLLAMKLTAARVDAKDMSDSIFLMKVLDIREERQLFEILEKYAYGQTLAAKVKFFTIEAFAQYLQEIEVTKD